MYDDVKIELKQSNEVIDRLRFVAAKARIRTLSRIKQVQEEEKIRELEKELLSNEAKATQNAVSLADKRAAGLVKAREAKAAKAAERAE